MTLPVLRPGQTHPAVLKLKRSLVEALQDAKHEKLASTINQRSRNYRRAAVRGVKRFQRDKNLTADAIVGEKTWRALGFHEPVAEEHPPALNGIPWETGLMAVDGRWVDKPLAEAILVERKAGRWRGTVVSGFRPAWYQKRLWDAAVKKYGSEQAAAKWVARPGMSRHGKKGGTGAVDVTLGGDLDASSNSLFRPMSWEAWHVQLTGTRDMPEQPEQPDAEVSEEDLAKVGVAIEDVDETIDELLEQIDRPNDEIDDDEEIADAGYDPEAARPTATAG